MQDDVAAQGCAMSPAKALAIAVYGESVASYRYRTLAEKSTDATQRGLLLEMADEEQGHHAHVQTMLHEHFPGSDFVLTAQDKELVIVGPRMLEVHDESSFQRAMDLIHESEQRTGRFYAALRDCTPLPQLKPWLGEMADECFDHAKRLKAMTSKFGA